MQLTKSDITTLSELYRSEYLSPRIQNPPKQTLNLNIVNGEVVDFASSMTARDSDSWFCNKMIIIDQNGTNSSSTLQLYNPKYEMVCNTDFLALTRTRCALLFLMIHRLYLFKAVGIIGVGLIGQEVIDMLREYDPHVQIHLYSRGTSSDETNIEGIRQRHKNVVVHTDYRQLSRHTDCIVTATSASHDAELLLPYNDACTKWVSFDGGFILDPEIRWRHSAFADSVEQINHMIEHSDEFPHDPEMVFNRSIKDFMLHNDNSNLENFSLYFSGMALFDLILAKYLFQKGKI